MLREFIAKLRKKGTLYEIKKTIPNDGILTAIMQKLDGKTILIHNFKNFSSFKLISGLVGSRENIALALNTTTDKLYDSINKAMGRLKKPKKSGTSPSFMENRLVGDSLSLDILPIQRFFESDGGPYITSALVIAKDPEQEFQNISFHRLMKLDKNHFAIRLVPRHLYTIFEKYKKMGKDTPIAIVIGVHPAVLFAASYPLPYGSDELWLANAFLKNKLEVSYLEDVDAFVPSHAEIVMTGVIKHDILHEEGPFVDITGTRDIIRKQPVVEISEIYYRNDPYYYTILPAGYEHRILMGMPKEVKIYEAVKAVLPTVKQVNMTVGGCGWLHAIISIEKQTDGDPKNVMLAAFAAHPSLKHCVVVDDDIDVYNLNEVEWAIATRFNGEDDLLIVKNVRGSSLDPSADQKSLLTTKIGLDATIPLTKNKDEFKKVKIENDIDIQRYLS